MAERPTPVDAALTQLSRARRDRWIVVVVLLVAIVVGALLIVIGDAGGRTAPWAIGAFGLVAVGYGISVVDQERRDHRAMAALVAERERAAALGAHVASLESLHQAARSLMAADELADVFDRLLTGALDLTRAHAGAVLLHVGDVLTVAASGGPEAPPRAASLPADKGVAGAALRQGEALLSGRGAPWGGAAGGSSLAAPLRLPDRVVGVLVVARDAGDPAFTNADVTAAALFAEHAALAVRNASRLDEMVESVTALETAAETRTAEVAGVVHDLKSPLSAIHGFVQLLLEHDEAFTAERRRAVLLDIQQEVRRLRDLTDGLVQVAAAEADAVRLDEVIDLAQVARDIARTGRGMGHEQGQPRQVTVTASRPVPVAGDVHALRRVVANLVDNAVAYSPPGSPIELSATITSGQARLTVRDHGPGLDPGMGERAFEPYRRGVRGRSGLGLYVARTLILAHGGTITLLPADGGGTLAEVVLPAAPASVDAG